MTQTFKIVRDPIDADMWRLVTAAIIPAVWGSVHCDFFLNGGEQHVQEEIALNSIQAAECVITTKEHYDWLMDLAQSSKEESG